MPDTDLSQSAVVGATATPEITQRARPSLVRVAALVAATAVLLVAALLARPLVNIAQLAMAGGAMVTGYYGLKASLLRWRGPFSRTGEWLAWAWLGGITLAAALAGVLPLAEGRDPSLTLTEPNLAPVDLLTNHPFGTDTLGLDILAQLVYGARVSLVVAFGASLIALVVGTVVGMVAGYRRGWVDQVIGFATDCILSLPALILLLAMVTFLSPTLPNITIALGVLAVPGYVRLARATTLTVAAREFVVATHTLGASPSRILFRNLLPNVLPPLIAYSFIVMSFLIVAEASLSFLGLGIQRPNPTWGNLIAQGQTYLETNPTLVLIPSFALFLTVMSANYIGQRLTQRTGLS